MRSFITATALIVALGISAGAEGSKPSQVQVQSDKIAFKTTAYNQTGTLKVTGPNGFYKEYPVNAYSNGIELSKLGLEKSGQYSYELTLFADSGEQVVNDPANGRENAVRKLGSAEKAAGSFKIVNGYITEDTSEEVH